MLAINYLPNRGTFNLDQGNLNWYKRPRLAPSNEVIVDNLVLPAGWRCPCQADNPPATADRLTQPLNEGGVSVGIPAHAVTWELAPEKCPPQNSLHNPIEVASLRYFEDEGTRYWTLHTDFDHVDKRQLAALAEMVRAEQARRK